MRIAITRNPEQLTHLMERAASKNITIVPLPVTRIQPVGFQWPDNLPVDQIDWLVFSSAHGVKHFFDRLRQLQVGLSRSARIVAVGEKTAEALGAMGRRTEFIPSLATGEAMFSDLATRLSSGDLVVYPQAATTAFDPRQLLDEHEARYVPLVCYRSVEQPLDRSLVEELSNSDLVLFTAPSSVNAFAKQFGRPNARILAIGTTTAATMAALGWPHSTMKYADVDSVLEYI